MTRTAVVATASTTTMDMAEALVTTCREAWPEADLHVLAAGGFEPRLDDARTWPVDSLNDSSSPVTRILRERDQLAWGIPRLLLRLFDDYDACVAIPAEMLVVRRPALLSERSDPPTTIAMPAGVTPEHSLTPSLGKLASRPLPAVPSDGEPPDRLHTLEADPWRTAEGRPEPRVVVVTPRSRAFLEDWVRIVTEAVFDVDQRPITWAEEAFLQKAIGRTDVALEGETTVLHWSNYAAVEAGRATGPDAAIIDCDSLFPARREVLADDPEVAWSMLVHRVHDSRPVTPLVQIIGDSQHAHPKAKETYFDIVRTQIWRALDPHGLRWSEDDADAFAAWLYEENSAGCTRLAHMICLIDLELFRLFPRVRFDPSGFRRWLDINGRQELGFDPFDRTASPANPAWVEQPRSNPLKWRWNMFKTLTPGYLRRLERRQNIAFLGRDPREKRGLAPPRHVPVDRVSPMWGASPRGLSLMGAFRSESGLGQASRSSLAAIRSLGIPFTHIDVTEKYPSRNADVVGLPHGTHGQIGEVNLIHTNADEMIFMRTNAYKHRFGGRFNAAMWFWEPADLPIRSRAAFHIVDELWVASRYQQAVFGQYGLVPVHVVGMAAELPDEREADRAEFGLRDDELVFLFVYDALSSYGRKNPHKALEAFVKAFAPRFDGVRMVLKVSNLNKFPSSQQEILGLAERYPAITVIDDYFERDRVMDLMAAADVSVSLHAAEGFGLTLLESMALGTPVIATAYSGNMDFTTGDNSWLVDYEMIETTERYGPYPAGSVWANPRTDAAVEIMRRIGEHRDEITVKGALAQRDARKTASIDRYAARLKEQLDRVM
jgi:glycosyltransferase involved in cell wall biosynthesis